MTDQKKFEEWLQSYIAKRGGYLSVVEPKNLTMDVWNAATEVAKPKWIPVSERLPEEDDYYPVLYNSKCFGLTGHRDMILGGKKGFKIVYLGDNYTAEVTHWLEKPELPE